MPRPAVCVVLLLLLAACGPAMVETDVTRFTSLTAGSEPHSFTVLPDTSQRGSLEFQNYAQLVANQLTTLGWQPVPASRDAASVVLMHWGLGPPATTAWAEPSMAWGGWSGWGGPWGGGFYGGYPYDVYTRTVWPAWVEVEILDGPAWRAGEKRVLWQGRAVTQGTSPSIAPAMPYLVRGLFTNFPGRNGETVRVSLPQEK